MDSNLNSIKNISKKNLFIGIGFIIVFLCLIFGLYKNNNSKVVQDLINIKNEGYQSKVEVASLPYLFAKSEDSSMKLYFVKDSLNHIFIVYLNDETYQTLIDAQDIDTNPIILYGSSVKILNNVKKLAITGINTILNKEKINNDNFENYFGSFFLDTVNNVSKKYQETIPNSSIYIILILVGLAGFGSVGVYIFNKRKSDKLIDSLSEKDVSLISSDIDKKTCIKFDKNKIYLTSNYIVDFKDKLNVIKYSDVLWVYQIERKSYGLFLVGRSIIIYDKKFRKYEIASGFRIKKDKDDFDKVYNFIVKKCSKAVVGYGEDQVEKVRELYKK